MTSTVNTFYLSPARAFVEDVSVQIRLRAVIESIGEANQQLARARQCDILPSHSHDDCVISRVITNTEGDRTGIYCTRKEKL